ncbi:MAG TPA: GlsB/YeaQ/YmgE family stress response membrane protein [Myxococcaceae bacterium]|nr:GlsB/YeaQ/YmgE family stress response membrane protein [Myxococcaceae bacterium]
MGLCGWIVFGFLVGLLARAVMPGPQRMGFLRTTLLGIVGSFVGGLLGAVISGRDPLVFQPSGFIGATIGAIIILAIGTWASRPS